MLYTKLTKEVIDKLWNNWRVYHNGRIEALTEVCKDAMDGYYEACKDGLLLTEEEKQYYGDYDPTDLWLKDKYSRIQYWQKDMISELKYETERFKEFLEDLSRLRLYDYQVGLTCVVDFAKREWNFIKSDDPKKAKSVNVRFLPMSYWYSWDNKYKRTVKYITVDPDFDDWKKEE